MNLKFILHSIFIVILISFVGQVSAQEGAPIRLEQAKVKKPEMTKEQKQVLRQKREAIKAAPKKNVPKNKLTPEQLKKLKQQAQQKRTKLSNEQKEILKNKAKQSNKTGNVKTIGGKKGMKGNNTSTPLTKVGAAKRNKDISKAKAISKTNIARQRVKAGDSKLGRAKKKLEEMKSSGKFSPEEIAQKEAILKRYESQLMQLDKVVTKGEKVVKQ